VTELAFLSIAEIPAHRHFASSSGRVTEAYLSRIAALDSPARQLRHPDRERALAEAKAAKRQIMASGPSVGCRASRTVSKESRHAGIRTTAMSKITGGQWPTRDAHTQEKLAAAGGVLLGKNATWEFAHGGPSWTSCFPPARNPWDRTLLSSRLVPGSAAAIAAGSAPTLGSDTGGSIRGPAAACGIAGLKPTYGWSVVAASSRTVSVMTMASAGLDD